jgi:glucose-1-phosphate thymidylyltransferase
MKIIIPMAGIGKRMRPHTLSVPKPLLKIAGKSIVERLVDDVSVGEKVKEIHYVVGNFGKHVEAALIDLAKEKGAKGFIHYQYEALGTAHAIYCASEALEGNVIIAFADTLFAGDFSIEEEDEAVVWSKIVDNPEAYDVVKEEGNEIITDFCEKPKEFISNKAIIGIYYFKKGEELRREIKVLLDNKITVGGEYQLTDALKNLLNKKVKFKSKIIDEWLDCGNKDEYLKSCMRIIKKKDFNYNKDLDSENNIVRPVFIGKGVEIHDSTVGPNVCIEDNAIIDKATLENTIIGSDTKILKSDLINSVVGNECLIKNGKGELNLGDFNQYEGK